ncbi:methyltransferase domain-containing protein [Candidatus Pelagibacter sp.]|nr:methyltransferase domain-containing protein [Candidatus Pelagibacter sp.]
MMKSKKKLFNPSNEIIKDFKGIYKNRSIKLGFLRKYAHTDLYVSKFTGAIIPKKIYSINENLKVWDKWYSNKFYSSNSPHFASRHHYTVSFAKNKLKNKFKIADLGCGEASLIEILNKNYGLKKLYGFEHSKAVCNYNKKKLKNKNIKFINCSIEQIDEKKFANYFDIIFLTWTLGSSARPYELIKKIQKILKINGHVVISESSRILVQPKVSTFWYFNNFNTFLTYPWRFSFNTLRNLLLVFDLKVIDKNNYKNNENLVVIAKKLRSIKNKKFKFDKYLNIINFFKLWLKQSISMRNFEKKC